MRTVLLIGGMALAAACAGGPGPGDTRSAFGVNGRYTGQLTVAGERFEAEFDLRTKRDGRLSGTFAVTAPVDVVGQVSGRAVDDLLRVTVTYEAGGTAECASGVEGILTVSGGGAVVDGPVTITDCGQALPGRLSLRKSPAVP